MFCYYYSYVKDLKAILVVDVRGITRRVSSLTCTDKTWTYECYYPQLYVDRQ